MMFVQKGKQIQGDEPIEFYHLLAIKQARRISWKKHKSTTAESLAKRNSLAIRTIQSTMWESTLI